MLDLIIIGAGAAGIFSAILAKKTNPQAKILILEKTNTTLAKVLISGGWRCNVTHHCFDINALVKNYPRGSKELLSAFHRFQPKDMMEWLTSHNVPLKTESDGRVFPESNQSQTIIDCFLSLIKELDIKILMNQNIQKITKEKKLFKIEVEKEKALFSHKLLLATGSNKEGYSWAKNFGHTIQKPIGSIFALNMKSSFFHKISGITFSPVELKIKSSKNKPQKGSLLFTHFGISGPVVFKLSAIEARKLYEQSYRAELIINWLPNFSEDEIFQKLLALKNKKEKKTLFSENIFHFPQNLWKSLLQENKQFCDISHLSLKKLSHKLHADIFSITGKSTNKKEFVTCGGVTLKEIDFHSMQSKVCENLFFAGEILDIDGFTGGFNFQSAWTTGFIAGTSAV